MEKYKIIIVENDEDERFFMKEGFNATSLFQIITFVKNGNELFEFIKEQNSLPDIILSDLNMPGMNGYEILEEIKSNPDLSHIPVIITSTSSTESTIAKCNALGASGYIVKPETFIDYIPYINNLHQIIAQQNLAV